jgi:hypothetical protein
MIEIVSYVTLGLIFTIELLYVIKRADFLPLRSNAQSFLRWYALCLFLLGCLWKWIPFFVLQMIFTLFLARGLKKGFVPPIGYFSIGFTVFLVGTATLICSHFVDDVIFVLLWGILWECFLWTNLLFWCKRGNRKNMDYSHILGTHMISILVIPCCVAIAVVPNIAEVLTAVIIIVLMCHYAWMRLSVLSKAFWHTSSSIEVFERGDDAYDLDVMTIFEASYCPREMQLYLLEVDPRVRDLYGHVEHLFTLYLKGHNNFEEKLLQLKDEFEFFHIPFSTDIVQLKTNLLCYMGMRYDRKILGLWPRIRKFFQICGKKQPLLSLQEIGDSFSNSSDEVIYAELKDFN